MRNKTTGYRVRMLARLPSSPASAWVRREFSVTASDKNHARTAAIEAARKAGYVAGECIDVKEV